MKSASPHALLSHAHTDVFQHLRVSAAIVSAERGWPITDTPQWRMLYGEPDVIGFELEHGVEGARYEYNGRCVARAQRERRPVLGKHAGLSDLFVPIVAQGRALAVLVTGPFATARPMSADVLERWHALTGRQGHPSDPEFAHFLSMALSTLVLEGTLPATFERFLLCVAQLMAGHGQAEALLAEADRLRRPLEQARLVERMWGAARAMVDERTSRSWSSPHMAGDVKRIGLFSPADQVVVGMLVSLVKDRDPVDDLIARDALQRACVALARSAGGIVSGQVGDHGVTFVSGTKGSTQRARRKLREVADEAAALARRRFGLDLDIGLSDLPSSAPIFEHYEAALQAAEAALSRRAGLVPAASGPALGVLRQKLGETVERRPDLLPARFDRFLEAVTRRAGFRLEPARAHLEAGFERIVEGLAARELKGFDDARVELERAAHKARTVAELFAAYRRVVADVSEAVQRPAEADRERRLRRAIAFVHKHYGEPLSLGAIARVAGFAPNYFSRLFKRREKVTLESYVRGLRIERAKQLLAGTDLEVRRVAQLSGFATQHYLARVFRKVVGVTPLGWRRRQATG